MDEADPALHARHRDLGLGEQRRRRAGRRHGLRAATSRRSRPSRRSTSSASTCRTCGSASSTSSTSCACSRRDRAPARPADGEFDALFTTDRPVIFAYHGYPWLIHRLTYRRTNHANLHVRGYKEEGTVTTPFDMVMRNDLDRFHLVMDVIDRVPGLGLPRRGRCASTWSTSGSAARAYAREFGEDPPEISDWTLAALTSLSRARPRPERRVGHAQGDGRRRRPSGRAAFDRTEAWGRAGADGAARDAAHRRARRSPTGRRVDAVGYRVVHGGERFTAADAASTTRRSTAIEALGDLAPLHNPRRRRDDPRRARRASPDVPHVAAFDTAFHATLPEAADALSRCPARGGRSAGIRRYGFHGLSVAWSVRRAAELLGRPADELALVVAHLGGGCSVTAVDRRSVGGTSMGMTPLEGLMMGTRAGSIDPGIIFRLLRDRAPAGRARGRPRPPVGARRGRRHGRHGARCSSARRGDEAAALAIEMFVDRAAAGIAAAATAPAGARCRRLHRRDRRARAGVTTRICDRLHWWRLARSPPKPRATIRSRVPRAARPSCASRRARTW